MAELDPVQFGRLIESVENLRTDVASLSARVETMSAEVETLSALRNKGVGMLFGLMLSGGALGALVTDLWSKIR